MSKTSIDRAWVDYYVMHTKPGDEISRLLFKAYDIATERKLPVHFQFNDMNITVEVSQ